MRLCSKLRRAVPDRLALGSNAYDELLADLLLELHQSRGPHATSVRTKVSVELALFGDSPEGCLQPFNTDDAGSGACCSQGRFQAESWPHGSNLRLGNITVTVCNHLRHDFLSSTFRSHATLLPGCQAEGTLVDRLGPTSTSGSPTSLPKSFLRLLREAPKL